MANNFIPVRLEYSGGSVPTGWAEYQTDETMVMPGSLSFTGSGRRITADFSAGAAASRMLFQTSTANASTYIGTLPSGTGTNSGFIAHDSSSAANCSTASLLCIGNEARLSAAVEGSGTYRPLTMYTNNAERARFLTSGQFIVGTTSLSGIGDGTSTNPGVFMQAGGLGVQSFASSINMQFSKVSTSQPAYAAFYFSGNVVGSITTTGTATAYNTSSDYRLKEDVQDADAEAAWARLSGYRIRSFVFKAEPDKRVLFSGVAHELAETNPDMVTGAKDAMLEFGSIYAMRPVGDLYDVEGNLLASDVQEPSDHGGWWNPTGAAEFLVAENERAPLEQLPGVRWEKTSEQMSVQGVDWSKVVPEMLLNMQTMKAKIEALESELQTLKGAGP
jgi:hypothetical protein